MPRSARHRRGSSANWPNHARQLGGRPTDVDSAHEGQELAFLACVVARGAAGPFFKTANFTPFEGGFAVVRGD
jgi:hypothetical protein